MAVTIPTLETERLVLRAPVAADIQPIFEIATDPEGRRYLGPQMTRADHFLRFSRSAGSWLLYGYGAFVIRPHGSEEVLGNCGIFHSWRDLGPDFDDQPEAGWMLRRDQRGRGLACEAMAAVLEWFDREHESRRVVCMIDPDNRPSIKLAERLGFVPLREATLPGEQRVRLFERGSSAG